MKLLSCVQLFGTPWTVAYQAPPSMGFSRQEYWSGLPFPSQEIFPTQGLNLGLPHCRQMLYHLGHQGILIYGIYRCMYLINFSIILWRLVCFLPPQGSILGIFFLGNYLFYLRIKFVYIKLYKIVSFFKI